MTKNLNVSSITTTIINPYDTDPAYRGDYYRDHFNSYWTNARLIKLGSKSMLSLKTNILNADLDCQVSIEDRQKVVSRIDNCINQIK
jgi:hypothetical protein